MMADCELTVQRLLLLANLSINQKYLLMNLERVSLACPSHVLVGLYHTHEPSDTEVTRGARAEVGFWDPLVDDCP